MERSLIWMESDVNGWACSNCQWRFPVPTLLSGEEAKGAYDRLAAAKFRQHTCEPSSTFSSAMPEAKRNADSAFTERARALTSMIAYTGRYRVEDSKVVTKVEAAWNEAWVGGEQTRFIRFEGDRLFIESPPMPHPNQNNRVVRVIVIWDREK